ncbi:jg8310 [Pararge aegeria aegeria]|uniref:Jg8310 protein n=1 Tax=Pararge aegeria aegeria TaxID=348720 RepID=A0A8S4SR28_9NEOP|nr:jg8310 [Pararge aegeria aegeria]
MRVRKKPDLRLNIPSYPHDYVEMPAETRKLIHDANQTANDIQYIDEDEVDLPKLQYQVGSPTFGIRSSTPEIKITSTEKENSAANNVDKNKQRRDFDSPDCESPVIYRKNMRPIISGPDHLNPRIALETPQDSNENIPEHHQSSASVFSDGDNTADDGNVLSDEEQTKVPLRSPRRKSTAPRRFRSEFSMDDDEYSPSNSVTSVNSLASLLKEKLQSIPHKIRKKPTDYKLRAFVGLMFLAVAFFVGFAYVLYHQQALTKAYFERVQFNEPKRLIRVFNKDDVEILKATLAVGLQGGQKAFPCLSEHRLTDGSECMEWLHNLRLYLKCLPHDPGVDNTTCYSVHWKALRHEFPELRYNICTSRDIRSLHSSIHSHRRAPLWDGLKPADMKTLESLISEPVWQIAPRFKHELQDATISKYTDDVINLGFLKQGHVLINEFWQNEIGDLSVDTARFETLNETVDKLHRRGFKVAFTIQPFISTESKNFAETVQKRLLINERNGDRRIPALTRFKSLASAGVLDITNNRSIPWILDKLQAVMDVYHIDSFYFDLGTAYDMPHYYRCEKPLINPDQYKTVFTKTFEKTLNIIGVSSAVSLPRPPIFISLPPLESTWEALRLVIPTMLTYGISGFPFAMPGAVGGDIYWPGSEQFLPSSKGSMDSNSNKTTQENGIELPERELYMRWLQMATFMPVMKFTHLPSKYNDERVLEMAKNLTLLRQKLVSYNFCYRTMYLPAGLWQDGIDGSLRKGNRWMHEYKVPVDRVAYFLRKPDDLRFK